MSWELQLAIQDSLASTMEAELNAAKAAVTYGIRDTIESGKALARQQVIGSGLGQRLANAVRGATYPNRGGKTSLNASGLLYFNAPTLFDAFNRGVTIQSSHGFYLAIPTKYAPKNVSFTDPVSGGFKRNKRVTPRGIEQALGIKLRFVFNPRGTSFLVADNLRLSKKRGTVKRASDRAIARGRGESLPLFWLVKKVTLRKRLDLAGVEAHMLGQLERNVLQNWKEETAANG